VGYGVFSNFGMKIFIPGGGKGEEAEVDTATKKEIFMKMIEVQGGLGMGIKRLRVVCQASGALDRFVTVRSGM
jgi:hypothetical protein